MQQYRTFWLLLTMMLLVALTACTNGDDNPVGPSSDNLPSDESVLHFFKQINAVPRPSQHEEAMVSYLADFAKERGLEYKIDGKNVIIYKDATSGMEQVPTVILQGHTDMVCVAADGYDIDFLKQGIESESDGTYIHSKDYLTSLGADDGIGVAIILAILDSREVVHGPLECVFTWDEELDFSGVYSLPPGILKGRYLFNIDWETEGEMCIGTAGGVSIDASLEYTTTATPATYVAYQLAVSGITGGHSGVNINNGGANAIKLLADFLATQTDGLHLIDIRGGSFSNVIASSAKATVLVPLSRKDEFASQWNSIMSDAQQHYAVTDPDLLYAIEVADMPDRCIAEADTRAMIMGLSRAPQGVVEWSTTIDNMFETSNNVGAVSLKDGEFIAEYLVRGFVNEKVNSLANEVIAAYDCANTGFTAVPFAPYSSWNPDINSPLMNNAQRTYQQYFGNPITLRKVGGGLELSVFAEVYPDMQCISFGPTILDAHSINERVDINSIHDCWRYTLCLLKDFTFI